MHRNSITTLLMTVLASLLVMACTSEQQTVSTILIDQDYLDQVRERINNGDTTLQPAYYKLIKDAEKALQEGPYTVTDKTRVAPSGDRHDYASYSRYWWPDPDKPDGLPYIRLDGQTNKASQSPDESDRPRIGAVGMHTETLGLAYYLTGNEAYAKKAAELLRVWFLDEQTRMNPNLNHAQCRPGHNDGSKSGVLDGRLMIRALDAGLLIAKSSALSEAEIRGLQSWASEYFHWLTTSELALQEAQTNNNHGSYYDLQVLYFALYCGKYEAAKSIAQQSIKNRVYTQIRPDGSMPEELARTRPLFYSIYNAHAMSLIATLAEKVDVDIWEADNPDSRLRAGIDHIAPYVDTTKVWPVPSIKEANRMALLPILQMAHRAYGDEKYQDLLAKLPAEELAHQRNNIAVPLMD